MSPVLERFLTLDAVPLACALLAAWTCAFLGCGLVLRREAMLADALAHSVLPGLVLAFLVRGERDSLALLIGGALAALAAVLAVEAIGRSTGFERGTAIACVFPVFFAAGVLLLELGLGGNVDLDASHVLNGQLELLFWPLAPDVPPLDPSQLQRLPPQFGLLALVFLLTAGLGAICWRRWKLLGFDPDHLAMVAGRPGLQRSLHTALVALASVAAFEAVGTLVTVALFLGPAATARITTHGYGTLHGAALAFASTGVLLGYGLSSRLPAALDLGPAWSAAGTIAVVLGLQLALGAAWTGARAGRRAVELPRGSPTLPPS